MVGSNDKPVLIPVANLNEFATLVFGAEFDFCKVMNTPQFKGTSCLAMFRFFVDDRRSHGEVYGPMEKRVLVGDYPNHSGWTVLSLLCRLGYIATGHYQIVLPDEPEQQLPPVTTQAEADERERQRLVGLGLIPSVMTQAQIDERIDRMQSLHSCR